MSSMNIYGSVLVHIGSLRAGSGRLLTLSYLSLGTLAYKGIGTSRIYEPNTQGTVL